MGYHSVGKLENLGREGPLLEAQRRITQRAGELLHRLTVEHTPVAKPPPGVDLDEWIRARKGRVPTTLKESWKLGEITVTMGGATMTIPVLTHDPIAPFVEWPTLPHIIVPRRPGGLLRFWDKLGNKVYATIVHHTGTKGSYMLTTALAEVAQLWQEIGAEEMDRWAHEQARLIAA